MAVIALTLEIPAGESLSDGLDCLTGRIVRIGMPDDWTSAALTFQVSPDGENYRDLYHTQVVTGAFQPYEAIVPTVIPNSILSLPPDTGLSVVWCRLRSGTRQQPVVQLGRREFTIVFESNL